MRIIFMGTPDFAVPCLEGLCAEGFDVCCVVTQPDKPRGRKRELTPPEVKAAALRLGLNVYQPETLKDEKCVEYLAAFAPDYIVVAAYGKLLPKSVLDLPKYGCVNVHGSLLPKYRGAAPIQRSVLNGDEITGVTTMLMAQGLDTGDMLLKQEYKIGEDETSGEVFDALAALSPPLLIKTLKAFAAGEITPEKQNDSEATHADMLTKQEAVIDWSEPMANIHNKVRGMSPWPCAYTYAGGKKLKILKTKKTDEVFSCEAGKVIADRRRMLAVCGDGLALEILSLQAEGARAMTAQQFLAGHSVDKMG